MPDEPATGTSRGERLLLEHCSLMERLVTRPGPPASERLEAALGPRLAPLLVGALKSERAPPP